MGDRAWAVTLAIIAAVVLGFVGLVAYVEVTEPESGIVTGKEHSPAWVQLVCNAKPPSCTPIHHPECWQIDYRSASRSGDACVSADEWQLYDVGDHYPRDVDRG